MSGALILATLGLMIYADVEPYHGHRPNNYTGSLEPEGFPVEKVIEQGGILFLFLGIQFIIKYYLELNMRQNHITEIVLEHERKLLTMETVSSRRPVEGSSWPAFFFFSLSTISRGHCIWATFPAYQ